jgi:predicted dehydrogenase
MNKLSRRRWLQGAAPMILSASVLGRAGAVAPNSKIRLACIGVGGQGTSNLRAFLADERVQVVALCDADRRHLERAGELAKLSGGDLYGDFREVLARSDVDAVMNATPDHWHAAIAVAAAQAGKDLYSEKPLGASIGEGRAICDAVAKHQRVLQCGTWRRSGMKVRMACEAVQSGRIGQLKEIRVGVPGKFAIRGGFSGLEQAQPVPAHLNYEMWMGNTAPRPYTEARCHFNFRWIDDYAPGYITDWGAHFVDVAQWGAGMDGTTPVKVSARGIGRRSGSLYDAPEQFALEYTYANGVRMIMESTEDRNAYGTRFIGSEGWIFTESEVLKASDMELVRSRPDGVKLMVSRHHHRNFIDAVQSRGPTAAPAEIAQRAAIICHMGAIAAKIGGELQFDPKTERFTNNDAANAMLMRPMQGPWALKAGA